MHMNTSISFAGKFICKCQFKVHKIQYLHALICSVNSNMSNGMNIIETASPVKLTYNI